MSRRPKPEPVIEELKENEEFISRDDIDIEILSTTEEEGPAVYV
jgi:hypothetical protein